MQNTQGVASAQQWNIQDLINTNDGIDGLQIGMYCCIVPKSNSPTLIMGAGSVPNFSIGDINRDRD